MKRLLVRLFQSVKITPALFINGTFFLLLSVMLFVGDGKQEFVDVVGVVLGVSLFVFVFLTKRVLMIPRIEVALFVVGFLFTLASLFWSDDAGYSLYFLVRFGQATLVYFVFYSIATVEIVRVFIKGTVTLTLMAIAGFIATLLFPQFMDNLLPQMNLLMFYFGHNHLANLLLLTLPMCATYLYMKKRYSYVLFFVVIGALLTTYARGAWIFASLFLVCFLALHFFRKTSVGKTVLVGGMLITMVMLVFISLPSFGFKAPLSILGVQKTEVSRDVRAVYWRQSIVAFSERFLFGSGPGTFFLQSLRLKTVQNNYSWFAHSFPLEILVEMGVVGGVIVFFLFVYPWMLFMSWYRKNSQNPPREFAYVVALSVGLLLTIFYSFIEFNLNFLVIWLLYWAGVGLLSGLHEQRINSEWQVSKLAAPVGIILIVFYVVSMAKIIMPYNPTVVLVNSYNERYTKAYFDYLLDKGESPGDRYIDTVLFFHRRHPELLHTLGKVYEKNNEYCQAEEVHAAASELEPSNLQYYASLVALLAKNKKPIILSEAIKNHTRLVFNEAMYKRILSIDLSAVPLDNIYNDIDFDLIQKDDQNDIFFAKQFYLIGRSLIEVDPVKTRELWRASRLLHPPLGVLYAELASLEYYIFKNNQAAQEIIHECMLIADARLHCSQLSPALENLTLPGDLVDSIINH